MDFKEEYHKYQEFVNENLKKQCINKDKCPEEVLNVAVEYALLAGGKRIRPILMLATYKMLSNEEDEKDFNYEDCLPYALAIEMVHNFSLIHDDLPGIDNDDFRHGKETVHKAFNEATAILAGDKLLNGAYLFLINHVIEKMRERNSYNISNDLRTLNEFTNSIEKLINGEYVDTESEKEDIPLELLEYIHKNKTGALIELSVRTGAILSNCTAKNLEKVSVFAEKLGLAFQIKDDILSEIGDEKEMGKPVGNDKERGKATYVKMYGLELAQDILDKTIFEAIDAINIYGEKAEFLKALARYVGERKK